MSGWEKERESNYKERKIQIETVRRKIKGMQEEETSKEREKIIERRKMKKDKKLEV